MWSTECCASEGQGGRKCLKEQPKVSDSSPGTLANVASGARGMGSGFPKGLVAGIQTILQSSGMGRGWLYLAVSKEMPSPAAANVYYNWAFDSLGIAPCKSHIVPIFNTPRHVCMWTCETCPSTHSVQHPCLESRVVSPMSGDPSIVNAHTRPQSQSLFNKINPSTFSLL